MNTCHLSVEAQKKTLRILNQDKYYLDTQKGEIFSYRRKRWVKLKGSSKRRDTKIHLISPTERTDVKLTVLVWLKVNGLFEEKMTPRRKDTEGSYGIHNLHLEELTIPNFSTFQPLGYKVVKNVRRLYDQGLDALEINNIIHVGLQRVERLVVNMDKGNPIWQETAFGEYYPPGRTNAKRSIKSH